MMKADWKIWGAMACVIGLVCGSDCRGGNISSSEKFSWSENSGWMNYAPSHGGGVTVLWESDHGWITGYAWAENVGFVALGSPAGGPYSNSSAANWGVNIDASGNLSGFAWSECIGWINFDPTHGGAVVDLETGDFSGYVWSENMGWMRLRNTSPAYGIQTLEFLPQPEVTDVSPEDSGVTVVWQSEVGVTYEVKSSDETYQRGASQSALSWSADYSDTASAASESCELSLSAGKAREYFRVTTQGYSGNTKVYGMFRQPLRNGWTAFSPPVEMDRRLNGDLGGLLASKLTPAANEGSAQAEVSVWNGSSWLVFWLKNGPVWCASGSSAESSYEVPDGSGIFVRNNGGETEVIFSGEVTETLSATNSFSGRTLATLSRGQGVALQHAFDEVVSGSPTGSADPTAADMIYYVNRDGSWTIYQYVQGTGTSKDDKWIDLSSGGGITGKIMQPGETFYYIRQGSTLKVKY